MFYVLLLATLFVSLAVSYAVTRFFDKTVKKLLVRLVGDELSGAWSQYLQFAVMVVGVSGGVRLWELEKYVSTKGESGPMELNGMRWTLEVYRTMIETLQSVAWVMLMFFLCAMIGFVLMRTLEARRAKHEDDMQ
ncbi:hypothetical protein [Paludibacterium paludis]|uniref:Uncharacterized protein n=1 Tax=Paludibacterium paludis TaxID=1225769 RepID=A0A918NZW3_9NEIS|nr:hypothetical protein [Paludibacterium paludis]GGY10059.1 hypothetical protein GCM10011289_11240 [Paludibacterium paludis]